MPSTSGGLHVKREETSIQGVFGTTLPSKLPPKIHKLFEHQESPQLQWMWGNPSLTDLLWLVMAARADDVIVIE
ncbi:hypothetical protein F2P81_004208 [Scophthalmus maximus]|uniref:Uncharacterized protein n=1 Tax=Scophthalmus maximus TaxID=52904 RepID=A0A6A4TJ30_SCOMX|nr:hypothetical protein F2P81_004208 [Scophthalmus maximus]